MSKSTKPEIITFKVDESLWEAMRDIPNRSEFIRGAIQTALDSACPLCRGAGTLSTEQKKHWQKFSRKHTLAECEECHAVHLVCTRE